MLLVRLREVNKMSFIKLDEKHQVCADKTYFFEKQTISLINELEKVVGKNRWLSIGRTDIEKGFMALHKGIAESYKEKSDDSLFLRDAPTQDIAGYKDDREQN